MIIYEICSQTLQIDDNFTNLKSVSRSAVIKTIMQSLCFNEIAALSRQHPGFRCDFQYNVSEDNHIECTAVVSCFGSHTEIEVTGDTVLDVNEKASRAVLLHLVKHLLSRTKPPSPAGRPFAEAWNQVNVEMKSLTKGPHFLKCSFSVDSDVPSGFGVSGIFVWQAMDGERGGSINITFQRLEWCCFWTFVAVTTRVLERDQRQQLTFFMSSQVQVFLTEQQRMKAMDFLLTNNIRMADGRPTEVPSTFDFTVCPTTGCLISKGETSATPLENNTETRKNISCNQGESECVQDRDQASHKDKQKRKGARQRMAQQTDHLMTLNDMRIQKRVSFICYTTSKNGFFTTELALMDLKLRGWSFGRGSSGSINGSKGPATAQALSGVFYGSSATSDEFQRLMGALKQRMSRHSSNTGVFSVTITHVSRDNVSVKVDVCASSSSKTWATHNMIKSNFNEALEATLECISSVDV